jgi:mono/diheme cytochrome c family protein
VVYKKKQRTNQKTSQNAHQKASQEISRQWVWIGSLTAAAVVGYLALWGLKRADSENATQVTQGSELYATHCAVCHGENLQGQKNWQTPLGDGSLRAPPHDQSGHTWHHPDAHLFAYSKNGGKNMVPSQFKSNMPGFAEKLSDGDIWAVLAYIKSRWPRDIQLRQDQMNSPGE